MGDEGEQRRIVMHGPQVLKEGLVRDKELAMAVKSVGSISKAINGQRKKESFKLHRGPAVGASSNPSLESTEAPAKGGNAADTGAATQNDARTYILHIGLLYEGISLEVWH